MLALIIGTLHAQSLPKYVLVETDDNIKLCEGRWVLNQSGLVMNTIKLTPVSLVEQIREVKSILTSFGLSYGKPFTDKSYFYDGESEDDIKKLYLNCKLGNSLIIKTWI